MTYKEERIARLTAERKKRVLTEATKAISVVYGELKRGVMNADTVGDLIVAVRVATVKLQDVSDEIWEAVLAPDKHKERSESL